MWRRARRCVGATGDLGDLIPALDAERRPAWHRMAPNELRDALASRGKCSALVKVSGAPPPLRCPTPFDAALVPQYARLGRGSTALASMRMQRRREAPTASATWSRQALDLPHPASHHRSVFNNAGLSLKMMLQRSSPFSPPPPW